LTKQGVGQACGVSLHLCSCFVHISVAVTEVVELERRTVPVVG
jgi:hypothetical protein